eukprot:GEMP01063799.1.p1 GENE.GEMP01063799.1~~GEMP01063799.1.p1  ORF type:complete len:209 (+),score=32.02 GEMP01063799.1:74-700(+)
MGYWKLNLADLHLPITNIFLQLIHTTSIRHGGRAAPLLYNPNETTALWFCAFHFITMIISVSLLFAVLSKGGICYNYELSFHGANLWVSVVCFVAWAFAAQDRLASDVTWAKKMAFLFIGLLFSTVPAYLSLKWWVNLINGADTFNLPFTPFDTIPVRRCFTDQPSRVAVTLAQALLAVFKVPSQVVAFYLTFVRSLISQTSHLSTLK